MRQDFAENGVTQYRMVNDAVLAYVEPSGYLHLSVQYQGIASIGMGFVATFSGYTELVPTPAS